MSILWSKALLVKKLNGCVKFMKKIVGFILIVSIIFLNGNTAWTTNVQQEENIGLALNLYTSSELSSKLESLSVDVSDSSTYEVSVLIGLDDIASEEGHDFEAKNILSYGDDIDAELKAHRDRVKEYYVEYNEEAASTLGLNDYEYYISYYSPYIEVIFDDLDEYRRCEYELIPTLSNLDDILSVSSTIIVNDVSHEATYDSTMCTSNYLLTDAFEDIGVSDSIYTGNGIKVGIIDGGVPYTYNLKTGYYTMIDSEENMHSTVIASIIGGTSGIAKDVYFYCMDDTRSIVDDSNLMINTYGVNIINMSLGYVGVGYYTEYDACVDNIVSNTGCTFVKSAGNRGQDIYDFDRFVTAPGCSINAITVGSVNFLGNVSVFSSWVTLDSFLNKPDVVAPGERLWDIPNISNINTKGEEVGHSGTSYAAPMVVGTIALLMEEFPILKTNPALVKSVLHLGAEKLSSQTNYLDQQAGFGLLDYQNMRSCLQNSNYSFFNISTSADEGSIVLSQDVTIPYLNEISVNANSIVNSSATVSSPATATPTYTDYLIKIYDTSTSTYVAVSSIDSSGDYLIFTNNNPNNSSFRIDIVLVDDSAGDKLESGAIAYAIHTHSYGLYWYYNNRSHIRYCTCGAYVTEGHYIRRSDIINNRYATCLGCREQLDLFEDYADSIMSTITQVSINGSYIISNGIVVLVDEDVQAYLDGTLVFYHPDDVPTTQ